MKGYWVERNNKIVWKVKRSYLLFETLIFFTAEFNLILGPLQNVDPFLSVTKLYGNFTEIISFIISTIKYEKHQEILSVYE